MGACVDPEERRILLEWQERTSYRQPAMSTFLSSVLSTLSFREMPGQVSRALFGPMSGHPLKGRGASLKKRGLHSTLLHHLRRSRLGERRDPDRLSYWLLLRFIPCPSVLLRHSPSIIEKK